MGECISIDKILGDNEFLCSSVATGTPFIARIDEDKRHLFDDSSWIGKHPEACPFLRPSGERILCTIHETSPAQCKAYRCAVRWIYGQKGHLIGTMTGTLALHTEDAVLKRVWEGVDRAIPRHDPDAEEKRSLLLEKEGYFVSQIRP